MKVYMMAQGSDAWWEARKGIPTCSAFDRIITPAKGQLSKQADDYACELIGERLSLLTPENVEHFTSRAIRWGEQCEAEARRWYEMETDTKVQQVGFVTTDDGRFGGSPDGLVQDDPPGGLELKCPQCQAQARYILDPQSLVTAYRCQAHGHLIVTGREWWDLLSYHPGMKPVLVRVYRDDFTEKLRLALEAFYIRLQELETKIKGAA